MAAPRPLQPRLFVSLDLPPEVRAALSEWRPEIPGARWVPTEKLHLTLHFLGPTSSEVADAITESLARLRSAPVPLATGGLLRLPSARRPRALTVEVIPSRALSALVGRVDRLLAEAGAPPREQPWLPHITLARFRPPDPAALRKAMRGLTPPVASGVAETVSLVESLSDAAGSRYVPRARVTLAETAGGPGG